MSHQRRPLVISALALLATPGIAFPQATERVYRIGVLGLAAPSTDARLFDAFVGELARRGYDQGRNLAFDVRYPGKDGRSLDVLAAELVALRVDVIFTTSGTPGALAAKKATTAIPIVMLSAAEPVRDGLISSLARPGGNVTGNAIFGLELLVKRLQLIAEAVGKPTRIAYLGSSRSLSMRHFAEYRTVLAASAQAIGAQVQFEHVDSIEGLDTAFESMVQQRVEALVLDNPGIFYVNSKRIAGLAAKHRLPAIADGRAFAEAGLLMTYGLDYVDLILKAASYIDRILKGANPGDLPVEQATKFEMIVNLKTANALGLTVPRSLLLRADDMIQ